MLVNDFQGRLLDLLVLPEFVDNLLVLLQLRVDAAEHLVGHPQLFQG